MGGMGGGAGVGGIGGGGTLDPMSGMMMLGMLIMQLCGDRDSWDYTSLFSMGMGGMGGMGMGGMGGGMGMGGMGGGMGGMGGMGGGMGMGGGFRAVPPTAQPSAALRPGQTRHLPTRLVSLNRPTATLKAATPAQGEPLQLGDLADLTDDPRILAAVTRLAEEKAPETVSQLALWRLAAGLDWTSIDRISRRWANAHELALARAFVARLEREGDAPAAGERGIVYVEVTTKDPARQPLAKELTDLLEETGLLGLKAEPRLPARPSGPSLACRVTLTEAGEAAVQLATVDPKAGAWVGAGKFTLPLDGELPKTPADAKLSEGRLRAALVADALAENLLARLVRAQLTKGPKVGGKETYRIRLDNVSPLVLNGVALAGPASTPEARPSALAGFSLPPRKSLTLPATAEMVQRLGLKDGVRAVAADLSAL
jgi:hypothetical protein